MNFPCFIIARILEREKKKLVKISGDLEPVIFFCIVKVLVMRNVKQPSLILAPVPLRLSDTVLVGLGSKIPQVYTLGPTSKPYQIHTQIYIHMCT